MKYLLRAFLAFIVIPITYVLFLVAFFSIPITTPIVYVFTGKFEWSYFVDKVTTPIDLLKEKISRL